MPRRALGLRLSICVGALVAAGPAAAQPAGNLPIDTFRPAVDSRGYLTLNASQVLGHGEVSFGLGSLSWGHRLLAFENGGASYSVDDVITATLIAAVGVKLGPAEIQIGASLPLSIMSGDRGPDDLGAADNPNDDQRYRLDGQGLGNAGIHVKTRFIESNRPPNIGVGVVASLFLPTVNPTNRFLGEDKLTPQLVAIVDKELGRTRRLRVALNGGIRLRPTTSFTDTGDMGAPPTNMTITASGELPVGLALAYAISPQKFDIVGEVFGSIPLGRHERYQPLEAVAGVKLYLARNSYLSLGAGRGLMPAQGGNPDVRAFIGIVFEPNMGDRDGDGFKDNIDKCPDDAEDFDGFDDDEGCPDPDNDRDMILDEDDKCPLVPEDRDGFNDEDGCPEGEANDRDGDKILDKVDACPDDPEDYDDFQDADGCPELDNDMDKLVDVDDLCPNSAEDFDQFEDADGCPELDNDKDRIADKDDKCRNEPEQYNNFQDEDGCDDKGLAELDPNSGIAILQPINFKLDSAEILPNSFTILDAVVAAMNGNPDIPRFEIQGHTDEQGSDAHNLDLSIRRAASVLKYLTEHGVDPNRLISEGYGETQPNIKERSQRAYAINRRVEFLIIK